MNPTDLKLYEKTMERLRRAGCRNQEEQIVFLADEIERYRAKIVALEMAKASEITAPVMCFHANAYTSPYTTLPEEEKTRRAQAEIAERLVYTLRAAGCISYESAPENHYPPCTEHKGTICVVMPKKESPDNG